MFLGDSAMARKTPRVLGNTLVRNERGEGCMIAVGTPAWFAWLEQASAFFFESPFGTFTACRERSQRGGWYWRAHRRRLGKVYRVYLGKAEALTPERLSEVAAMLTALGADREGRSSALTGNAAHLLRGELREGVASLDTARAMAQQRDIRQHGALVATKLLLPPAPANLVSRPRLAERLEDILWHKLTLVSAPAGFGKTTLLSQWGRHTLSRVAWVSLDGDDDDPARFWTCFITALQFLYPGLAEGVLNLLRSPSDLTIESSLAVLINVLAGVPEDFVVVLDDYHVIESQVVHRGVEYFLDHMPLQAHLVIATRADPPLPLARLRGKGQMLELRAADLAFTHEEATAFLNQVMNLELSADEVAALGERTEGWAVGLQVAGLSLRGHEEKETFINAFAGGHRHIIDYLMEEVFGRQSEAVQSFLLETSILQRLSAPACEAVTGQPGGQAMLETLERANLFTLPLDGERHWYRYHRLFADFLRARLQQTRPERVPELHLRAADWLAKHDLPNEAVSHALAAKDFELAAELIEQCGVALRRRGEVATILAWLRSLPDETVRRRPRLCLLHAWLLVSIFELDAGEARLREAEQSCALQVRARSESDLEAGDQEEFAAEALALRAQIATYRGDWPLAIELGRQALERTSRLEQGLVTRIKVNLGSAYWRSGDIIKAGEAFAQASSTVRASEVARAIPSLCSLANAQRLQGYLRDAARTYGRALDIVSQHNIKGFPYISWPYLGLGRLRYEWNDLSGALHYAEECIRLTRDTGLPLLSLAGYTLVERVKQAVGDLDGALETNWEAQQLAHLYDDRRELSLLRAYQARLWLKQGNLEAACRWARECGLSAEDQPSYDHEPEYLALAQVLIAQGYVDSALGLVQRLRWAAEAGARQGSVIKLLALEALAWEARSMGEKALAPLERALSLAQPEGYVRTFVDRGTSLAVLLSRFLELRRQGLARSVIRGPLSTGQDSLPAYIRSLLSAFLPVASGPASGSSREIPDKGGLRLLTEREREVLELIAAGRSAPEIAREFVVSVSTVKTHLRHIYDKLDAHSGREAVAKARELSLL